MNRPAATSPIASPVGDSLLAARLVLSDDLALESQDATHVTVFHRGSAARLKISRALYRFLLVFRAPRRVGEVVPREMPPGLLSQLRLLVDRRMLEDADAPPADAPRLRVPVAYRLCGAPALGQAPPWPDCVVLGVPYDLGGDADCRSGPAVIRQKSLDVPYEIGFSSGRPRGWFDANRGARILEGATIADAGDVHVEYGEDQRDLFARIRRALDEVCPLGSLPLVLGGDRSITWPVVDALRWRGPLAVVQFARQPATAGGAEDGFVPADAVARRLAGMDGVEVFAAAALEGDAEREEPVAGARLWSAALLRAAGPAALARRLGDRRAVHLSFDLSATTRDCAGPGAAGLTLAEIAGVVRAIGAAHRIIGVDLVGLDTDRHGAAVSGAVACHLALGAMSAALDRARSEA